MLVSTKHHKIYNKKQTEKLQSVTILADTQISRITGIQNIRDKAICYLLLHTGIRLGELTDLDYSSVFEKNTIKDIMVVTGKGNKSREIYLNDIAKGAIVSLDQYNRTTLHVRHITGRTPLIISKKGQRLSKRYIQLFMKEELNTTPHVFRHTCLTHMRNNNIAPDVLQRVAGHSSFQTTSKYYLSVTSKDLQIAYTSLEETNKPKLKLISGVM